MLLTFNLIHNNAEEFATSFDVLIIDEIYFTSSLLTYLTVSFLIYDEN